MHSETTRWPYRSWGSPQHPLLLMLHGFMGNAQDWESIAAGLSAQYYCVAPDLPGHGENLDPPPPQGYSMAQCVSGIGRMLETLHPNPCTLLGYSMGGRVALHLALQAPKYFHRLILESSTAGIAKPEERAERSKKDEALAQTLESMSATCPAFEGFLKSWYAAPLFASLQSRPSLLKATMRRRLQNSPQALAASLRGMGTGAQENLWAQVPHLTMPLHLIVGEEDKKFQAIAQELLLARPETTLHSIADCGHNVHLESPDRYTETLNTILQQA